MHEKHDYNPVFSPDGKSIAFSSNRHGSYDVFVIPVEGGRPTRLTFDSADDQSTGWSPDGQHVLFASGRRPSFPLRPELFTGPGDGGQARQISAFEGRRRRVRAGRQAHRLCPRAGHLVSQGLSRLGQRRHLDLDADGTNNRQLTHHNGQDNYPTWSPDGKYIYYVSDCLGRPANVVRQAVDPQTRHRRARHAARARHRPQGRPRPHGPPQRERRMARLRVRCRHLGPLAQDRVSRKLRIEVNADDKANPEKVTTFTTEATEFALSHDEKHVAFVVHGEIFLMPRSGGKAQRLTESPAFDHGIAWSPDRQEDPVPLRPLGPRGHLPPRARRSRPPDADDGPSLQGQAAHQHARAEMGISFAPDGKRVAFLRAGKLMTMNPDGTDEKLVVDQGQVFDYEWSPDGKWICYARMDGSFASELFIMPASGRDGAGPAAQHHALRHVQRRRHLEPDRQQARVHQPARAEHVQRLRAVPAKAGSPSAARRARGSTGTTSICASSPAAIDDHRRMRHLRRRQPARLPQPATTCGSPTATASQMSRG